MDGRIISVQTPSESEESNAEMRIQMYRDRLAETAQELEALQKAYNGQRITPGTFAERWHNVTQTKHFLEEELHRMGV